MRCDEAQFVVDAYVDGELDVRAAAEVRRHVEACARCSAAVEGRTALSRQLGDRALRFAPPHDLRARIRSALRHDVRPSMQLVSRAAWWLTLAASLAIVTAGAWFLAARGGTSDRIAALVADAHVRSLLADHLTDVASTDQHTVKPWFDGRIDFAPPVFDLTPHGYDLIGGRLDYLDGRPVAALVYHRRKHPINLLVWPAPGGADQSPVALEHNGFHLVRWRRSGMQFWAVSDLDPRELQAFVQLLRSDR